jgi:uncharacterized RDD family membrane protein YckC
VDISGVRGLSTTAPAGPALPPAGLGRRLAALCYDLLLLAAGLLVLTLLVLVPRGGRAIEPGTPWFSGLLAAGALVFFVWFWTHGGQTLGMTAWRIELRTVQGGPVPLWRAVLRFAAAWLSLVPGGLGFVWALVDVRHRTWHDLIAGTVVVRTVPEQRTNVAPASREASAQPRDCD